MHLREDFPARGRRALAASPHAAPAARGARGGPRGQGGAPVTGRLRAGGARGGGSAPWPRTSPATATWPASVFTGPGVARASWLARRACCPGLAAFAATAELVDPALRAARRSWPTASAFAAGAVLAELRGPFAGILAAERTGLNFLCRLSGVATLTARYVAETSGTRARIAATRKTTPGLRALEKQAVVHGGGTPHRFGLFDGAMIKDNHIAAAGGVARGGRGRARRLGARAQPRGGGRHARAARGGSRRRRRDRPARQHGHAHGARGRRRSSRDAPSWRSPAACASSACASSPRPAWTSSRWAPSRPGPPWLDLGLDVEV